MSLIAPPWHPCDGWDPELERLRRLARRRQVELEKQRLREWLWRHGMPAPEGPFPAPMAPMPRTPLRPMPIVPLAPRSPEAPRDVADVIDKIQ